MAPMNKGVNVVSIVGSLCTVHPARSKIGL